MRKMQVLFPEPVLRRLRELATEQDRPVSELVRRAVDRMLEQAPNAASCRTKSLPLFDGGAVLTDATRLKAILYDDDAS